VCAQYNGKVETLRDYVKLCGTLMVPFGSIMLLPDLGTGLIILVIGATIIICSGAKRSWILVTVLLLVAVVTLVVVTSMIPGIPHILKEYQMKRLTVFLDPSVDPSGDGYNLQQAKIAVGSGGFIGKGPGNATQANSIASSVTIAFNVPALAVGITLAVLAGMIIVGGVNRIANIAQFVVPFMAIIYILCAVVILFEFSDHIVPMFNHIFTAAFNPEAVLGGAAGIGMREAVRYGVARGLFSNEAGMGSTPHAHATADVNHPVQQGLAAFIGVFIDTILVCTATALIILLTDANLSGEQGAAVTQFAFSKAFPGFGSQLLAVCLTFFAFTTIIGWYYFGESNIRFLFRGKHLGIYRALVLLAIVLGTLGKVDLVWSLSDMFNGFMVIPNLIALFLLRKEIRAVYDDYLAQKKAGKGLSYQYEFHEFHDKA